MADSEGCSAVAPVKNSFAEAVRMTLIERFLWCPRAWMMLGSLIVATEPLQARSRWILPSDRDAATAAAGSSEALT